MITYTLIQFTHNPSVPFNKPSEFCLTAKTDNGARRQAKQIIKSEKTNGNFVYKLKFYRDTDGCSGTMDI